MPATAVVGANWGDEGKGKITDVLAAESDLVVRFQGGRNAGHTIINQHGKFVLHLLPSGVFYPHTLNLLGPGVAVDIDTLCAEMEQLTAVGIPSPTIAVSDRAQVVMPFHTLLDECEEERLGRSSFGSTKVGIAPFYADKYLKLGVQVADLLHPDRLRDRVSRSLEAKNVLLTTLYGRSRIDVDTLMPRLIGWGELVRPYLVDAVDLLHEALGEGKHILLEGQLGALRDPDHGIYPYPTSSHPVAGFAAIGAGLPLQAITDVVAVAKAYSTCVGAGPFVTELEGAEASVLRARGGDAGEFGATTGRPRRVGWFDAVATRYGCRIQGATELALTGLDVLGHYEEIPICVGYEVNGVRTEKFPVPADLDAAVPVYERAAGWLSDISGIRNFEQLPTQARQYVRRVEELVQVPVTMVSVGPRREEIVPMAKSPTGA